MKYVLLDKHRLKRGLLDVHAWAGTSLRTIIAASLRYLDTFVDFIKIVFDWISSWYVVYSWTEISDGAFGY